MTSYELVIKHKKFDVEFLGSLYSEETQLQLDVPERLNSLLFRPRPDEPKADSAIQRTNDIIQFIKAHPEIPWENHPSGIQWTPKEETHVI